MKLRLFTVLVLVSSALYAQVLFQQSFDCDEADNAGCADGADSFTIQKGSIDYPFVSESGNRAKHFGNHKDASWNVDVSAQKEAGKTIYLSFIARCLSDSYEGKYGGVGLFMDDDEQFGIGNDFGSKYLSYYNKEGAFRIGDSPLNVDNEAHLFVARFEFKKDETDSFTIWLDPLVDRSLDDQDPWRTTSGNCELNFNQIRIRAGHEDYQWEYDEIKIGESWDDVVTTDKSPGGKVLAAKADARPGGMRENVMAGVNRFLARGVKVKDVSASLAVCAEFDKPKRISGRLKQEPVFSTVNGRKYVYIETPQEDDFYGTGEVTGGIRRNGYRITLNNKDNYCYNDTDNLYQAHPWVIGVRPDGSAYGVIFDTTWKSEIDLHSGILFSVPEDAKDFPVYTLEADSPAAIVDLLGEMTGKMPLPPKWALGYQQCRFSYYPDARAREVATGFRERQIPCDVLWFDIHYMDGYRIFTFDKNLFPDPSATNQYLHDIGFKSVWMIDPGVKLDPGYFVYDSGTAIDAWVKMPDGKPFVGKVWPGDCVFPDFTRPDVRKWWAGLYKDYIAQGVDGVWNDMNDPSVFDG
ncbi:MAG: TIM-barrel domain-containing protein, partial [Phycisphaerae bacterium]